MPPALTEPGGERVDASVPPVQPVITRMEPRVPVSAPDARGEASARMASSGTVVMIPRTLERPNPAMSHDLWLALRTIARQAANQGMDEVGWVAAARDAWRAGPDRQRARSD